MGGRLAVRAARLPHRRRRSVRARLRSALSPLLRLRRPARPDVLARLDRDSKASHRPATSLADTLANDHGDADTQALWAAHQARLEREIETIRVAPPSPRMVDRDPYALRFGVALLAFAAAVVAGPEMYGRLAAAFDWRSDEAVAAVAASRIDAWIDPPPYAGQPPLVIDFKSADPQTLTVPEDSVLVVRGDPSVVGTRVEGGITPAEQKAEAQASAPARTEEEERRRARRPKSAGRSRGRARRRSCAMADPWRPSSSPSPQPASRRSSRPRIRAPTSAAR